MSPDTLMSVILEYRYWILIPLSFIEGPMIAFVTGTLAWLGYFNPYVAFTIFIARDVILDGFFYFVGRFGGKTAFANRWLAKIGVHEDHIEEMQSLWLKHGFSSMFVSKLSYGLSASFLMCAGFVQMGWKKFFAYATLVALAQYGILFILGYFFGTSFGTVSNALSNLQYIVGAALLVASLYYIFTRFVMRKKMLKKTEK